MKLQRLRLPADYKLCRYLVPFDLKKLRKKQVDVLVVGSGMAGIRAAIEAGRFVPKVAVLTKARSSESSSFYAQGGIAAAISDEDSVDMHMRDTLRVGLGLNDEKIVKIVISEGVECVKELVLWGVRFDREQHRLSLGLEGGHTRARILHRGDETGMAATASLINIATTHGVEVLENTVVIDLLTHQGSCVGALCQDEKGERFAILAQKTILATGGAGQIYRETTNPAIATGDGLALAFRAGAPLVDMEFVQFHPTALYLAGAGRILVSEAVRGAGAILRDRTGRAFMKDYHQMGDLAPRDVVSRAILAQMKKTGDTQMYLDIRPIGTKDLRIRFPQLASLCEAFGLDPARDWVPVRPAAHYTIGGILCDEFGRTGVPNLYAVGECAGNMFHGANRLASNSLLECLVFGRRAGMDAGQTAGKPPKRVPSIHYTASLEKFGQLDLSDLSNSLKSLMWRAVGVERDERTLQAAIHNILFWSRYIGDNHFGSPAAWELQNMMTVALSMATSALTRVESRGTHFRTDYPKTRPEWLRHLVVEPPKKLG